MPAKAAAESNPPKPSIGSPVFAAVVLLEAFELGLVVAESDDPESPGVGSGVGSGVEVGSGVGVGVGVGAGEQPDVRAVHLHHRKRYLYKLAGSLDVVVADELVSRIGGGAASADIVANRGDGRSVLNPQRDGAYTEQIEGVSLLSPKTHLRASMCFKLVLWSCGL